MFAFWQSKKIFFENEKKVFVSVSPSLCLTILCLSVWVTGKLETQVVRAGWWDWLFCGLRNLGKFLLFESSTILPNLKEIAGLWRWGQGRGVGATQSRVTPLSSTR